MLIIFTSEKAAWHSPLRSAPIRADRFLKCQGVKAQSRFGLLEKFNALDKNESSQRRILAFLRGKTNDFGEFTLRRRFGAVEWIRTTTVLLPPAPQAGASASSATTALRKTY
jgi:hypothetical protein